MPSVTYGITTNWQGGRGGNWNVPRNWTRGIPGSADQANIGNGYPIINTPAQAGFLNLGKADSGRFAGRFLLTTGGYLSTGKTDLSALTNEPQNVGSLAIVEDGDWVNDSIITIGDYSFSSTCLATSGSLVVRGGSVTSPFVSLFESGNCGLELNGGVLSVISIILQPCMGGGSPVVIIGNGGTLRALSSGQNLAAHPINLLSGGLTFDTNGMSNFISSPMSGVGGVTILGDGSITFTGYNTYTGDTNIQAGTLTVANYLASSNIIVGKKGILVIAEGGFLAGQVINSGVVSPGGSGIGKFTIGSYTQKSDGTLLIQIGSNDVLEVNGVANIDGTLQVEYSDPNTCGEFTILTAAGGVNGTFSDVITPGNYELVYNPNSIDLLIPCLLARDAAIALNIKDILFNVANTQYGQVTARLAAIRAGASGISFQGVNQDPLMEQFNKREKSAGKVPIYTQEAAQWDVFVAASGVFSRINNVYDLPRFNSITGYFSGGADYRVNENIYVGIYAGYQGSRAWYNNASLRSNGVKWGLYGTAECNGFSKWDFLPQWASPAYWASQWSQLPEWQDNFYVNAIVGGGANFLNINRLSGSTKYHRTARSYPFCGELDSLLGGGYEVQLGPWRFGLNNSIQYTYLGISAFSESGAKSFNLRIGSQTPGSLVYTLGGSIAYLWEPAPGYVILPTIGLSWQHEFLNYGQRVGVQFANGRGAPTNFYSSTAPRNNAFGLAGITAQIGPRFGAYAYYNPQFGGRLLYSNGVVVGLTYAF